MSIIAISSPVTFRSLMNKSKSDLARDYLMWLQHLDWRPISSAPKDGTHFLACDARVPYSESWTFNQRPPTVVHWWGNPGEEGFYTSVNELEPQTPFEATHWKPLGEPPGAGS